MAADRYLRELERKADNPEDHARLLRHAIRAGVVPPERVHLAALLGHQAARLATSPEDRWPMIFSPEWVEWLAHHGLEACVRVVVALGRFRGGGDLTLRALEAATAWLEAKTDSEAALAAEAARTVANEGPLEPWGKIGALFYSGDHLDVELAFLLAGEREEDIDGPAATAMRATVAPWALETDYGNLAEGGPQTAYPLPPFGLGPCSSR